MVRVITENINPNLPEDAQVSIPAHLIDKGKPGNLSNCDSVGEESAR